MRRPRPLLLVGALLLGALLPVGSVGAREASGDPRRPLDSVLEDGAYQTELPGKTASAGDASRSGGRQSRETSRRDRENGLVDAGVRALFDILGPLVGWLAWIAVVVAVLLLVGFFLREAWRSRGDGSRTEPPPSPAFPEPEVPAGRSVSPPAWEEIETLAARGAFGEAVHLLFLYVLERLRRQGRLVLSSAVTGREVLGRVQVREDCRQDLAELVSAVERFHFADVELTREDWERSRETHRRLLEGGGEA